MFVELYRTKLSIEDGVLGAVKAVGIIPADVVINTDSIISISTTTTESEGVLYHRVRLVAGATEYKDTDYDCGKVYITDVAYERLVH